GWRPHSLRAAFSAALLSPEPRLLAGATGAQCATPRAHRRFLSTRTASLSGRHSLFGPARGARCRSYRGTRYWLRARWHHAPSSPAIGLFLRTAVGSRLDPPPGPRRFLPPCHLPLLPAESYRQPLWPQHCRCIPSSIVTTLQGRSICLAVGSSVSQPDLGGRTVRSRGVVAGRISQ